MQISCHNRRGIIPTNMHMYDRSIQRDNTENIKTVPKNIFIYVDIPIQVLISALYSQMKVTLNL